MIQKAHEEIPVNASPQRCMEVATDFESYPLWAPDIKDVTVHRRDPDGRGNLVSYTAAALGRSITYTLEYFYGENPLRCAWQLNKGDLLRLLSGKYEFVPSDESSEKTLVTYELSVDLAILLPSFVKRRLETRLIHTAVDDFRDRVEKNEGQ